MNKELLRILEKRTSGCDFCGSTENIQPLLAESMNDSQSDSYAMVCTICHSQLTQKQEIQPQHWHSLNESIWSEIPAVKVLSYRMLHALSSEGWTANLLDMMYLEDDLLTIAQAALTTNTHFDSNGVALQKGDSVTLIKDLEVKGTSMVAKRGTAVRNILLVHDNTTHIEGKVNGRSIYIKTEFVKK